MSRVHTCDIAVVGGGLAGCLVALALAEKRPDLSVRIVEGSDRFGGNHVWSFFGSDVADGDRWLLRPLVCHAWPAYDVAFPGHARTIAQPYYSIESERLDAHVRATFAGDALLTERRVLATSATNVVLGNGERVEARGVIDARGLAGAAGMEVGWQKFVGREYDIPAGHGLERPVVMDATVPQLGGYRFVYLLPFSPTRVFVEDTYYADTPEIDADELNCRLDAYVAARGWRTADDAGRNQPLREEAGALPVVIAGDFDQLWGKGTRVAKAGARAGLFHPTTGYSLPDAVRLAVRVAAAPDLSGAALHDLTHDHARARWNERGFYRMLDAMLFKAAEPEARWRVLERFYRLSPGLIGRFYASRSTLPDMLRVLAGRPPVPVGRALKAIWGGRA